MQTNILNQRINIVLCLAGKGQRFVDQGYKTPKFLLRDQCNQVTILSLIIKNLALSGVQKFFLIFNKKHRKWEDQIKHSINEYGNLDINYFFIKDTSGQAETAYQAAQIIQKQKLLSPTDPIGFHNGDTILFNRNLNSIIKKLDQDYHGAIDTFHARSNAYSYVKTSKEGTIEEMQEKKVISSMASTGLYIFKSYKTLLSYYEKTIFLKKERYISEIYQTMIKQKLKIFNLHSSSKIDTLILGTPCEYEKWIKNG